MVKSLKVHQGHFFVQFYPDAICKYYYGLTDHTNTKVQDLIDASLTQFKKFVSSRQWC